ncbi:signal peptidase I [Flammeovirga sp. MY04]|uniref:signal peptidase I n=1 Tax=Flammeovirga sp. MY04 TaxID=1191459 RepID=UPI0008062A93|nr:signal peptidase I [Flammeovirga sp. MY04]ANQ52229.1 signal peptidase I [Flammeovirga sp. MY04]
MNQRRNPWIAGISNFFILGLGQLYNGELKKGILFLLGFTFLPFIFRLTHLPYSFFGFWVTIFIIFTLRLYVIIDAVKSAKRLQDYTLKAVNKWYFYFLFIVGSIIISLIFDNNSLLGIGTFSVASESMEPTITQDDYVAVKTSVDVNKLEYGDIVVFSDEEDEESFYICRVVAQPGDKVMLKDNFLVINGLPLAHQKNDNDIYTETLPNFKNIDIRVNQEVPKGHESANTYEFEIASDAYFLIGDNRDSALDSRYLGEIKKDRIKGKLLFIPYGFDVYRIGTKF